MLVKENLSLISQIHMWTYIGLLIFLAVLLFAALIRAIKGPRIADRLIAVNMMGTMVIVMLALLSLLFEEGYLVDICLIYAMISFLSIVVVTKVYTGIYMQHQKGEEK